MLAKASHTSNKHTRSRSSKTKSEGAYIVHSAMDAPKAARTFGRPAPIKEAHLKKAEEYSWFEILVTIRSAKPVKLQGRRV